MTSPKVSIIVPVYKVGKYLHKCIDSILTQTFTDFECILVDDCSPDKCPVICEDYAKQDTRIKVIHKEQSEGLPKKRKTGFEASSGDYIQYVDSDDWIEPDMVEKLYNAAINSNADLAFCDFYVYNTHGYSYGIQTLDTENNFNNLGFVYWCTLWNKLFHREIINRIEFPKAGKYEDRAITQQALFYVKKIIKVPYPLYHYSYNQESMFREISIKIYLEWIENIIFVISFLHDNLGDKFLQKKRHINEYVNSFKFKILKNITLRKEVVLLYFFLILRF
jgi:glycosyltransferase involved in cell wall biosynthesis